jgi:Uncharacterized protein conserved in bacteria
MEIILFITGSLFGAAIIFFVLKSQAKQVKEQFDRELSTAQAHYEREKDLLEANHQTTIAGIKEAFETEKSGMRESRELLSQNYEKTCEQMEKQWKEKNELLKAEFQVLANEVLEAKQNNLRTANKEQLESLLNPLKERMHNFENAVKSSQISGAENKASLEKAIEEMMKRTQEIGKDAVNLTKALKGNSKVQGDWGEMILESILEKSGLRKDEEYTIQESITVDGERVRPDVIVHFPEKRSVVIDSKVSLTAYVDYMNSMDDEERTASLKRHIKSIRDHMDELSNRDYTKFVEQSVGYVLMFIPNEASYILAVQNDANLAVDAYSKKIVIISPTNLMMALQLAYNLWQSEKQTKNVQEIVKQSGLLYDKVAGFANTFIEIGDQIEKTRKTYDKAQGQLSEGSGNILRRVENLKKLGIKTNNVISDKLLDKEGELLS